MIRPARCPTARVAWSTSERARRRRRNSAIGMSPIGMSGFGNTVVYGARRVPRPPARITARTSDRVLVWPEEIEVLGDPLDRPLQPFVERDLRLPAQHLSRARRVGAQALHLAGGRAEPSGVFDDRRGAIDHRHDLRRELGDRDLLARPEVDLLPP